MTVTSDGTLSGIWQGVFIICPEISPPEATHPLAREGAKRRDAAGVSG